MADRRPPLTVLLLAGDRPDDLGPALASIDVAVREVDDGAGDWAGDWAGDVERDRDGPIDLQVVAAFDGPRDRGEPDHPGTPAATLARWRTEHPHLELIEVLGEGPGDRPAAADRALRASTGDVVVLLGPGARLEAGALPRLLEALAAEPGATVVYGDARRASPDGRVADATHLDLVLGGRSDRLAPPHGEVLQAVIDRRVVPTGGTAVRRDALTAVGGWDPGAVDPDLDLWLRLALDGRFAVVAEPLATIAAPAPAPGRALDRWAGGHLVGQTNPPANDAAHDPTSDPPTDQLRHDLAVVASVRPLLGRHPDREALLRRAVASCAVRLYRDGYDGPELLPTLLLRARLAPSASSIGQLTAARVGLTHQRVRRVRTALQPGREPVVGADITTPPDAGTDPAAIEPAAIDPAGGAPGTAAAAVAVDELWRRARHGGAPSTEAYAAALAVAGDLDRARRAVARAVGQRRAVLDAGPAVTAAQVVAVHDDAHLAVAATLAAAAALLGGADAGRTRRLLGAPLGRGTRPSAPADQLRTLAGAARRPVIDGGLGELRGTPSGALRHHVERDPLLRDGIVAGAATAGDGASPLTLDDLAEIIEQLDAALISGWADLRRPPVARWRGRRR